MVAKQELHQQAGGVQRQLLGGAILADKVTPTTVEQYRPFLLT